MNKLKELLSIMYPKIAIGLIAIVILVVVLPGFIGSEKSEESSLTPVLNFHAPPSSGAGDDAGIAAFPDPMPRVDSPACCP